MDPGEFQKLKARELDRVRQAQKGSGSWAGRSALYREIFGAGHPYAEIDANDETLKSIELADVRAFYKKTYVQGASFVVVAGDVDQADVVARIEKHVALPKGAAPTIDFPPPKPANAPRVVLARRPGAKQSDIFVGGPTLDRRDPSWPAMALATATLGDGMSSRLFLDVREKRSLAYSTNAGAREFANGPAVVVLYAGTQTAQTPRSVTALFEHLGWISGGRPVEPKELALSKSKTETSFLFRLETIGAVASLAVEQKVLGLPGRDVYDYVAGYRTALREAPLEAVRSTAATKFAPAGYVLAVAGDPSLAAPLRRFGSVKIVDPENGFAVVETLPADPAASLEVPAP
jgi:predicted Zn-dependent peptidase